MNHSPLWPWAALFLLGAYHGLNPGMGWLFAVALGMQKKSAAAVWQSLVPIAAGHFVAIGLVVAAAAIAGAVLPLRYVKIAAACVLLAFGLSPVNTEKPSTLGRNANRFSRFGHLVLPDGFRSRRRLHAAAHLAENVIAPRGRRPRAILLTISTRSVLRERWPASIALLVHTLGYLLVTGLIAFVVYEKLGLEVLRKTWVNLDLIWAVALIATAGFTLLIPT